MAKLLLVSCFLFLHIGAYLCLDEFNPDGDTVKGATVSLVCTIEPASFTSPIFLTKDGSSLTSCDNGNICNPTSNGRYAYSSNSSAVTVTITSLTHASDTGNWTCSIASSTKDYHLVVQTEPTVTTFINGSSTALVSGTKYKTVNLSARSYCFFPSVSSANLQYSIGISGSVLPLTTISVVPVPGASVGCVSHEFDLQTTATVDIDSSTYAELSGKSNVYFQITFTSSLGTQHSTDFRFGPYDFEVAANTESSLFLYAFLPVLFITLLGTVIVIVVACYTDKDGKLKEGSMKESCDCCPSENNFCMAVCPLCTDPLCEGSKESVTMKNVASVVVLTILAAVIGIIIAFGLGLESGKYILALVLSIVCGIVLVVIFIVSVYPHWPCVPEKGENAGNCFKACRINPEGENKESGNQDSPKKDIQRMK